MALLLQPELDSSEQNKDQQDNQDNANEPGRTITPAGAVWPSRNDAEKYQDEDDDQNGAE